MLRGSTLGGGAQRSPLSSAAPLASPAKTTKTAKTAKTNPGQKARSKKPEYHIPAWTAPPTRIIAAAVIERLPVITPNPEPWEIAMWELQDRKEDALALELPDDWFEDDSGGLRKAEEADGIKEDDPMLGFAPRVTEADAANDVKSLDRKLDKRSHSDSLLYICTLLTCDVLHFLDRSCLFSYESLDCKLAKCSLCLTFKSIISTFLSPKLIHYTFSQSFPYASLSCAPSRFLSVFLLSNFFFSRSSANCSVSLCVFLFHCVCMCMSFGCVYIFVCVHPPPSLVSLATSLY